MELLIFLEDSSLTSTVKSVRAWKQTQAVIEARAGHGPLCCVSQRQR